MHVLKTEQKAPRAAGFSHTSSEGEESYGRSPKLGDQIRPYGIKRPRRGLRILLGELEATGSTNRSEHVRRKCHPAQAWLEEPCTQERRFLGTPVPPQGLNVESGPLRCQSSMPPSHLGSQRHPLSTWHSAVQQTQWEGEGPLLKGADSLQNRQGNKQV